MSGEAAFCTVAAELPARVVAGAGGDADWLHAASCSTCRAAVEQLLAAGDVRRALRAFARVPSERPPTIVHYRIEQELARGGQGVVYRARQLATGRTVALKVLSTTGEQARKRMAREFELLARLECPGLVRLYDCGEQDGRCWAAMELVDGEHVDAWLRATPREPAAVVAVLIAIARAVQSAHLQGIVHRDLKPANVLIDRDGRPRVLDFGMGVALTGMDASVALTASQEFVGTVAWAAPEQLSGQGRIDGRCDVHALGVLAYFGLAGRHPFAEHRGLRELVGAIASGDCRPPRHWRPRLSRDLDAIIRRAMATCPEARYPSAEAFADDLQRWQQGGVVEARAGGATHVLLRAVARHRLAALAAVAVFLCVGISVGLAVAAAARSAALADERTELAALLQARELIGQVAELWPDSPAFATASERWLMASLQLQQAAVGWRVPASAGPADWRQQRLRELLAAVDEVARHAEQVRWRRERAAAAATAADVDWSALLKDLGAGVYAGTRLRPDPELMPLRRDPRSGLWESWHPRSGTCPEWDAGEQRWILTPDTGLVFVLLPGVTAQLPAMVAVGLRSPALWMAKYPMTSAQWARLQGQPEPAAEDALRPVAGVESDRAGKALLRLGLQAPSETEWLLARQPAGVEVLMVATTARSDWRRLARPAPRVDRLRCDASGLHGVDDAIGELRRAGATPLRFSYGIGGAVLADGVPMPRTWIRACRPTSR